MEPVFLCEAGQADLPTLVGLIHTAFEEYRGVLDPPSGAHAETVESVQRKMEQGGAILAFYGGEPAGCVLYEIEPDHLYLGRLSVLPGYRQRGIGRQLVKYVEDRACGLGRTRVRLGVRTSLEAQVATYQHLGYALYRAETHEGFSQPTFLLLEKQLCLK